MKQNYKLPKEVLIIASIALATIFLSFWLRSILHNKPKNDNSELISEQKKSEDVSRYYDSVRTAEKKLKEQKSIDFKDILEKIKKEYRVKYDDIENTYWIYDKSSPVYNNQNGIYIYLGLKENTVWRRFRIQYLGDDWLFVKSYIFKIDDNVLDWTPSEEPKRDNGGGDVWEITDESPTNDAVLGGILTQLELSKNVKIRFVGDYTKDKVLSASQIKAINKMDRLYFEINQKLLK